jgi:hypothetical protein
MASKSKISQATPREISVLSCQASAATTISFNVCNVPVAKSAIQQKCA